MILPQYVEFIINRLEDNGFSAYAVGGCVRDSILGNSPEDYDVATNALPCQVKSLFDKTFDTGLKHGTVTVLYGGKAVEVTTYRIEDEYTGNRRPSSVSFVNDITQDLARRDFTINAIAYNPRTGVVDPYGGKKDLDLKIIRCVGDADKRFDEDALRMLRAIRFSCKLGFEISEDTVTGIKNNAKLIENISAERIASELVKMLMSDYPENIGLLCETGISGYIFKWLDVCMNTPQNTPYHIYSVGEHMLKTVCFSAKDRNVRLAAFLHDCGKPYVKFTDKKGTDHFKGHEEKSASLAGEILKKLRLDNKTVYTVTKMIKFHRCDLTPDKASVRRFIYSCGKDIFPYVLHLMYADSMAHSEFAAAERIQRLDKIKEIYNKIIENKEPLSIKELAVNGQDLNNIGIYGKRTGECLEYLMSKVLDMPEYNKKEILLEIAENEGEFK